MGTKLLAWTLNREPRQQPSMGRVLFDFGSGSGTRLSMGIDSKRRRKSEILPDRRRMFRGSANCRLIHGVLQLAWHRKSFPNAVHAQSGYLRGSTAVCLAESNATQRVSV